PPARFDATYLVVGGLGALGIRLGRWLAERGARHIVLTSRSSLPPRAAWEDVDLTDAARQRIAGVRGIEAAGASVELARVDASDAAGMQQLIARLADLRGIFYAAGVSVP